MEWPQHNTTTIRIIGQRMVGEKEHSIWAVTY